MTKIKGLSGVLLSTGQSCCLPYMQRKTSRYFTLVSKSMLQSYFSNENRSKIDDSVLNGLEAYLKENKNIEQIALSILGYCLNYSCINLTRCKNITDKGIKDLLNTLKHLKNLRAYKVWSREI